MVRFTFQIPSDSLKINPEGLNIGSEALNNIIEIFKIHSEALNKIKEGFNTNILDLNKLFESIKIGSEALKIDFELLYKFLEYNA